MDDLAMFSADAIAVLPILRAVISQHQQAIQLRAGQGMLVSNTRWLHGRDRYTGPRVMLRILGDPLPGTGIQPGFPRTQHAPSTGSVTTQQRGTLA